MVQDHESFRAFAAARLPALHRSAVFLVGDPFLAEDLVQEALTRVYLAWGRRPIHDPVAYTHTTLTRVFLSSRRRRSSTEYPVDTVPEVAYDDSDIAARLDLQRALAGLNDLDRAIVVMRYLEDRSAEDVAAAVGCTPGNVRVRASRALTKLRGVTTRHGGISAIPTPVNGHRQSDEQAGRGHD
ncbi:SigE family RNA polymerase sigma factor [Nocardioides sp. W7]|uniref:SigE family RNA polymerase sigma factor n=1 Tax=Nocardioides sp. W7 TaxID=2931390 RepID=UPI001FD56421|nr:SigE family RNA polymerase sigma factor [Nocardioides sp. W7]